MSQPELLKAVVYVLDSIGVPYMLTGSTVSSLQGNPRSTHDIDMVVAITSGVIERLAAAFPPPDYYLDSASIGDAIAHHGMFNLLDAHGGDKVDFWVLASHPFDRSCFDRRYLESAAGIRAFISQPEDTILNKLRWAKLSGGSEKQFQDCMGVYEVQYTNLDMAYLDRWAKQLGVADLLLRLKREARPE